MPAVIIELLGGFAARRDGASDFVFETDKTRALLAYLAVEREKTHRRETLAGLFWPDMPEHRARAESQSSGLQLAADDSR